MSPSGYLDQIRGVILLSVIIMGLVGTFGITTAAVNVHDGNISPSTPTENSMFSNATLSFTVDGISKDGDTDTFYITVPDALATQSGFAVSSASATNATSGATISITSSVEIVDGPDADSVVDTITFAISPTGGGNVSVSVSVSFTLATPTVTNDTTYEFNATVQDSTNIDIRTVTFASITVVNEGPKTIPGFTNEPKDLDNDGLYEDVNGDGTVNIVDVQAMFAHLGSNVIQNNPSAFDYNNDGDVDIVDVQKLFTMV